EYNFDNIFRLCLKDTHEDVWYGAVEGLWENEETSLIDPLIDILENDESAKVQAAAATALGKFAVMAELEQLHPESAEKVIDTLLSAIDNRDNATDVTKRVLESAASISLPDVHEAINNAYYSSNPDLKISALFAMGKSFDSSWLPILIQELENDDAAVRFEAAGACGELESPEAVPALVTLAENDEDIEVRCAAIQALGKIGSPPAQEYIQLCLKSSNDAVREAAEDALGFIHAFDETLFHEWKDE
ncbi:MAG: HEAT repeat domain-containing protein, partial [Dehalococcoidales bacterium]|nr:HEAT repeat domain-containing protein [Dehalococcoidales bacterium]